MKKGAMEMSIGTIVTIILLLTILFIGLVLVKSILDKEYNFYGIDCKLTSIHERCNDKLKIERIFVKGIEINEENVNKELLDSLCNKLDKNTWGCGKYLVIKE